jgi:CheY-like chemotaxis protein
MGNAQGLRAALVQGRRALPLLEAAFSSDGEMDVPSGGTLVFIDLILPTGDGRDVCQSLRLRGCAAFIVAVVPTAGIMHNRDHLARIGFDAMVLSPVIDNDGLHALVLHALSARHVPDA